MEQPPRASVGSSRGSAAADLGSRPGSASHDASSRATHLKHAFKPLAPGSQTKDNFSVKITLHLTSEQLAQAAWHTHWELRGGRDRQTRVQTLIFGLFIVYLWWLTPPSELGWIFWSLCLIFLAGFWFGFFPWLMKRSILNNFRRNYSGEQFKTLLTQKLTLSSTALTLETPLISGTFKPGAILRVVPLKEGLLILLVGNQMSFIPSCSFKNESDQKKALQILEDLTKNLPKKRAVRNA